MDSFSLYVGINIGILLGLIVSGWITFHVLNETDPTNKP